jgi:membrane protein DedA with SNARE-associated domain
MQHINRFNDMPDWFQSFAQEYALYGYPVLFIGVLLENMGIPVPGETAVLVAGFLSSNPGGGHFHIGVVIAITVVAAVIGDNIGFWLGHRWARPRLQSGKRFLFLTPKTLELAESYFQRYGLWTIFFARFITGLRVVGALAAGTAGMHWTRFLIANACGAVAWATTMALLGYFFGSSLELLHTYLSRGGLIVLGSIIVIVGLPFLLRRLRQMRFKPLERVTAGQIVQGLLVAVLEVTIVAVLFKITEKEHETHLDRALVEWIRNYPAPLLDALAALGNWLGSLPALTLVTLALLGQLRYRGRPWRELAAALWALAASEIVGLALVGLLHAHALQPSYAAFWPKGFAGLMPLRAFAVFGMTAALLRRQNIRAGRLAGMVAFLLVLLIGFGVVWMQEQTFTETMLEFAAGGLVLFAGLWWLEGFGPGLIPTSDTARNAAEDQQPTGPEAPSAPGESSQPPPVTS